MDTKNILLHMMTMATTSNENHQLSVYNCMRHTAMQLQQNMNSLVQVPVGHDNNGASVTTCLHIAWQMMKVIKMPLDPMQIM